MRRRPAGERVSAPWFYERAPGFWRRMALLPLGVASRIWSLGAALHRAWYRHGPGRAARLPCKVLSVGNLVVGGSGKTPTTAWIANALRARGHRVAVASRGYGGRSRAEVELVSDGRRVHGRFESSGDEPMWLASRAPGVPVLVGRRRDLVGRYAVAALDTQLLLLDDGFQHHRLARDLDLLTFHGASGLGNGRVLPRGPLREGLRALARADAVIVVDGPMPARDAARIRAHTCGAEWFELRRSPQDLRPLAGGPRRPPQTLAGEQVGVLSGIAHPDALRESVQRLGARVVAKRAFPDHHRYRPGDFTELASEAPLWVTTEKDAGKIQPAWAAGIELLVLALETSFVEPERFLAWLEARLGDGRTGATGK